MLLRIINQFQSFIWDLDSWDFDENLMDNFVIRRLEKTF